MYDGVPFLWGSTQLAKPLLLRLPIVVGVTKGEKNCSGQVGMGKGGKKREGKQRKESGSESRNTEGREEPNREAGGEGMMRPPCCCMYGACMSVSVLSFRVAERTDWYVAGSSPLHYHHVCVCIRGLSDSNLP